MSDLQRLTGSARLIAILTLGSRILGLLRETVFGYYFGASPLLSAFRVAFQAPNLARRLFGEGALTASFIPVFTRCRESQGEPQAARLAGAVFTMLAAALLLLLALIEAGLVVASFWKGGETLQLTQLLMPYMVLICLTAFFGGLLNALNRFAAPALAPTILNLTILFAAWLGSKVAEPSSFGQMLLISGAVLVAGCMQLGLQWAALRRTGFRPHFNFDWRDNAARRVLLLMGPMVLGMSAVQVNTFADSMIALFLVPDGQGPAVLGYAQYLHQLPLGIFSIAIATAIFPLLARQAANGEMTAFTRSMSEGARVSLAIAVPAGIGLILVAEPLVRVLFEHGEFSADDTRRVAMSLTCYGAATFAYSLQHIFVRAFYSLEDSRTPSTLAGLMVLLNVVLNLLLVRQFREAGIALATAVSGTIQMLLLGWILTKRLPEMRWRPVMAASGKALAASAAMTAVVLGVRAVLPERWGGGAVDLAASLILGGAAYLAVARLLGLREIMMILPGRRRRV